MTSGLYIRGRFYPLDALRPRESAAPARERTLAEHVAIAAAAAKRLRRVARPQGRS